MTIAGLMSKSKYSSNIIRTGDIGTEAPYTLLTSTGGTTTIQLPFPSNISSSLGADWQQEQVGKLKYQSMHGQEAIKDMLDAGSNSFKDLIKVMDHRLANAINSSTEDSRVLLTKLRDGTNSRIGGSKVALNPRNEMLFNGMSFRSFSFNFMLVPLSKSDSDNIQQAIKEIQKASVPALRIEKMFMEYPETWNIKFMDSNKYLVKINECCCTGITTNYAPNSEQYELHEDNAPLAVELTLDFTEVFIPSKDNIDEFHG